MATPTETRKRAAALLLKTGIAFRPEELDRVDLVDFALGELETTGAEILSLVLSARMSIKLIALLPGQTLPEHRHPPLSDYPGKEETIRCAWGVLYLYGPGEPTPNPKARPPEHRRDTYTQWHEHILLPGDQVTFPPNTPHWFQGGPEGAVVWSFCTQAYDNKDVFSDKEVVR